MRGFGPRILMFAVVFAYAITLPAQTGEAFTGKWQLNVAKSKFSPGPAPKSETVTVENGTTSVEGTGSDGQPFKWSFTPSPGKAVPIEGQQGGTVEAKESGNTVDHTWSGPDGTTHGHGVVSKDGKTMTYTQTGTQGGKPVHNVFIFEKQ